MTPTDPDKVRYIKLGIGGRWAARCLADGEMHFGYPGVPHDLCAAGQWDEVFQLLRAPGRTVSKANDAMREIRDFYTLGADWLWITFADGHLWWAFADPQVSWLGRGDESHGARMRKTLHGWRNEDLQGRPLRIDGLSTVLTQTGAYRQTICRIKPADYLLRRIHGVEEPVISGAREARQAVIAAASEMIAALHWADFETLVDLIFARTGWQRVSRLGETQADVDLVLEQSSTGERAFVQVKSKAGQRMLDDYIGRFRRSGACQRMFFVCHSPKGTLSTEDDTHLHLWAGERLADATVKAGLFNWLMERTA